MSRRATWVVVVVILAVIVHVHFRYRDRFGSCAEGYRGGDVAGSTGAIQNGEAVARETARNMEYPFPDDNTRRV